MIEVVEESSTALTLYAQIPIAFTVNRIFEVQEGVDGRALAEQHVPVPYVKDYDAVGDSGPLQWSEQFDISAWAFFLARLDGRVVGGATVAFRTADVTMLDGRDDLAVLWDIRVVPDARRRGVGAALFSKALDWARTRECSELKIETQNVNVGACRFYERCGCELRAIHRSAYATLPDEMQLLWYRSVSSSVLVQAADRTLVFE